MKTVNKIYIVVGSRKKKCFFIEFVISLYSYLKDNNYNVELIRNINDINPNNKNLHIGIFNNCIVMPQNYIMFNIEPFVSRSKIYNDKLYNSKAILNFTKEYEVNNLNNILFPITYHPAIENIFNINRNSIQEDIDVLFYGCMNDRRLKLVKDIKEAGINIFCPNKPIFDGRKKVRGQWPKRGVFGAEKDILIERSKIILISLYYEYDIDIPRCVYCLSKKKFIIADSYGDNFLLKDKFNNLFPVVETNEVINTIKYYLLNEKERNESIEKSYKYIKEKYKTENYIKPILKIINNS
jgi:hypothetical protein